MKEFNNRQKELLEYLKQNTNRYVSKKQICRDLPYVYPRHLENNNNEGNKSVVFSKISSDIRTLNDSDLEQIVICNHYGYKLAKKIGRNHQLYFSENDIKEIKSFIEV